MSDPIIKKKKSPKYLEKMLLVNHKEEQLLQERLDGIHIRSRTREMELERERIKVRDEWKESRRRQIPRDSLPSLPPPQNVPQRKLGTVEKPKFNRATSLPEGRDSDNVNSYLLGEYRRMSEVIPSILLALSKKDEKKAKLVPAFPLRKIEEVEDRDQEPDLHRITKLARSVKKMRENMSFQKKIDMNRPRLSLAKMFKDMHEHRNEIDQYTDGTCVLLKRKLEKRRRESMPELDASVLPIRRSSDTGETSGVHKSQSAPLLSVSSESTDSTTFQEAEETDVFESNLQENLPNKYERSKSLQFTPSLPRHHTTLERRTSSSVKPHGNVDKRSSISAGVTRAPSLHPKRHSIPHDFKSMPTRLPRFTPQNPTLRPTVSHRRVDSHANTEFIDEDELRSKQKVAIELQKFEKIQRKVDRFLIFDKSDSRGLKRGYTLLT
jgi:hypothetical protein